MVRTIGKQNKIGAVLFLDHWRTGLENVWYSNVFGIQMIGIKARLYNCHVTPVVNVARRVNKSRQILKIVS